MLTGELARELGVPVKVVSRTARRIDVEMRGGRLWWTAATIEQLKQRLEQIADNRRPPGAGWRSNNRRGGKGSGGEREERRSKRRWVRLERRWERSKRRSERRERSRPALGAHRVPLRGR